MTSGCISVRVYIRRLRRHMNLERDVLQETKSRKKVNSKRARRGLEGCRPGAILGQSDAGHLGYCFLALYPLCSCEAKHGKVGQRWDSETPSSGTTSSSLV